MPIPFLSPIHSDKTHPLEKWAFLRSTTHFFDFGQKAYTIRYYDNNQKLEVMENGTKPSWIGILLRVAALFTVVIPLFMLFGAWIYRSANRLEVCHHPENKFNELPSDLLGKIFQMSGPSIRQLAATSKTNQQIIDAKITVERNGTNIECANPLKISLTEEQLLLRALEQCYDLEYLSSSDDNLENIALNLAALESPKALYVINRMKSYYRKTHPLIVSLLTTLPNQQKALEIANLIDKSSKPLAFAIIAKNLLISDPQQAMEMMERALTFVENGNSHESYKIFIQLLAYIDPEKALGFAIRLKNGPHNIQILAHIAKIYASTDPEKAMKIIENSIVTANSYEPRESVQSLVFIIEALALLNPDKVAEVADQAIQAVNLINGPSFKSEALIAIAKALALSDSSKAAEILKLVLDEKFSEFIHVLPLLAPQHGVEIADLVIEKTSQLPQNIQAYGFAIAAAKLNLLNPQKAKEIVERAIAVDTIFTEEINFDDEAVKALLREFLSAVRILLVLQHEVEVDDLAIEKINQFPQKFQSQMFAHIFATTAAELILLNPQKAKKLIELAIAALDSIIDKDIRIHVEIAQTLKNLNHQDADDFLEKALLISSQDGYRLAKIAKIVATKNLKKAMDIANTIPLEYIKRKCLLDICNSKTERDLITILNKTLDVKIFPCGFKEDSLW